MTCGFSHCSGRGVLPLLHCGLPSHGRLISMNSSSVSPSHRQQSSPNCCSVGLSSRGAVLQGQVSPAWEQGPSLHGAPTGSQPPPGIHQLQHGLLHGLQVDLCIPHGSPGAAGAGLSHHGLQGNLGIWNISCPSSFTDLGVHRVVLLTSSHSALLWPQLQPHSNFVIPISSWPSFGQQYVHL